MQVGMNYKHAPKEAIQSRRLYQ